MGLDMMNSVAAASMSMSAAKLQQSVSLSMTKKVMDSQEVMAQKMLEMLPDQGHIIDTYA